MKHFIFPRDAVAEAQRALRADDPQSHAFYLGQADGLAQARRGIPYDRKMATETDPFSRGYSVGYGVVVKGGDVGKKERQSGSPQRTGAFAVRSKSGRVIGRFRTKAEAERKITQLKSQKSPRGSLSQAEYIARLDWSIKDVTEALLNAVGMQSWANARKYIAQIEKFERLKFQATAGGPKGKFQRRLREEEQKMGGPIYWKHQAGARFGRGRLPDDNVRGVGWERAGWKKIG